MAKLLIVDDEEKIREIIKKYAVFEGHTVIEAKDGMDAIEKFKNHSCDLIILDIMMPELDGFSVAKEIRKTSSVPIIMLSARSEEYDKIHGFELGIDDYVVKPFSPKELFMRVEAVLKRTLNSNTNISDVFSYETLLVDFTAHLIYIDNEKITLSPKEYDLLVYLIKNKGIALTRERLISDVWGYEYAGETRAVDMKISNLRKKLDLGDAIRAIPKLGYRLEER